jgi:hypothetical protein
MISSTPWKLDENDPAIIYYANGEIIAKDYKFEHIDDFEFICRAVNFAIEKGLRR